MAELESVMQRLDTHTKRLRERSSTKPAQDGDEQALLLQGLALLSEAVLKVGRDVRFLRLERADQV